MPPGSSSATPRLSAAALAGDLDAAQQQLALINGAPRNRTRKEQS